MNKPCPFCGDIREASIEELVMNYDPPNMFFAACQCCGAQGPAAITRGAALVMWDERRTAGDTKAFCELADRLAGTIDAARRSLPPSVPALPGREEKAI